MITPRAFALSVCMTVLGWGQGLAQESRPAPIAQVAMLPLPATGRDDLTALIKKHWEPYFQTAHPQAFDRDAMRMGRFDLDGDGQAELFLILQRPDWLSDRGLPVVVAAWTDAGWNAIGWSWGDPDTIFITDEIVDGRRTIDTGGQILRWDRGLYSRYDK